MPRHSWRAAKLFGLVLASIALAATGAQAGRSGHHSRRNTVHKQGAKRHSRTAGRGAPVVQSAANESLKDGTK